MIRLQQQTSISSCLTSRLLEWRNPQGREENWLGRDRREPRSWSYLYKALPAEVGITLLMISAVVETVVYAALVVVSRIFSRVDGGNRYAHYMGCLDSSAFTILWNATNLGSNWFQENVLTHESFARARRDRIPNLPSRLVDSCYIADWARRHGPRRDRIIEPFFSQIAINQETTNRGATHIVDHVLSHASEDTLNRFNMVDVDLIPFVLMRAIFTCAFVRPHDDQILRMGFKVVTAFGIYNLWHGGYSQEAINQMAHYLSAPEQFQARLDDNAHADEPLFNIIQSLHTAELQNSIFLSRCWQRARELLNQREVNVQLLPASRR
ncbi:MAG: hypothetical protein ACHQT8_00315 [Chlamydiales bacterium]